MQERNYGIELYRVLLVWGICFLHSVSQGLYEMNWLVNSLLFCVDGFVFITGYYGASFKLSKIFKLYGTALYTGLIIGFVAWYCDYLETGSWVELLKVAKKSSLSAWFLNGYVVLLCFTPMIEKVLKGWEVHALLPLLLLVFGWAFLSESPYSSNILPRATGISAYSGLTLLGVYVCGRLARILETQFFIKKWCITLIGLSSLFVCMSGFGNYASPFAVVCAMCLFYFFKPKRPKKFVQLLIDFLGPSLFAVYLLHSNQLGFMVIKDIETWICFKGILGCLTCSVLVMGGCLILDLPRRLVVLCLRKQIKFALYWVDTMWDEINRVVEQWAEKGRFNSE